MLDGHEGYDACSIFDQQYPPVPPPRNSSDWSSLTQHQQPNVTKLCENFEFEQPSPSVVTKYELVCEREILVSVAQHLYLVGIMLGGPVTVLLLKKVSPLTVLLAGAVLQIAAGTGSAFAPWIELHSILKLLTALGACCMFTAGFQICSDICGGWHKTAVCVGYEFLWSVGVVTLGWLSDVCGSWVNLQLVISLPTVLMLALAPWLPDSPRWLIASGRTKQAETLLREAASFNSRHLGPDFQVHNPNQVCSDKSEKKSEKVRLPRGKVSALLVLWVITVVHYYGGLLNMRNVGGPRLPVRTSLAAVAEVLGTCVGGALLLGCRRASLRFALLSLLLAVGGVACISSWALTPRSGVLRGGWPLLGLALTCRVAIASSLAVLSCGGSAELLPVSRRPLTMLALVTVARLFLLTAPFLNTLAKYGDNVPLSVYGVTALLGAAASLYLACVLACSTITDKHQATHDSRISQKPPEIIENEEKIIGTHFNPCFVPDN